MPTPIQPEKKPVSSKLQLFSRSLTLAPATPTPQVFDMDPTAIGGPLGLYFSFDNTGANPIGTILWERSADGTEYVTDLGYAAAVGTSLAAATKATLDDDGISSRYLRITFTSVLGTTLEIRGRVTQP